MSGEPQFCLVAAPAVIVLGLPKGGFTGVELACDADESLLISPVRAAAIVLPVLVPQDWVSVAAFGRDFSPRRLPILIPASAIGGVASLAPHASRASSAMSDRRGCKSM